MSTNNNASAAALHLQWGKHQDTSADTQRVRRIDGKTHTPAPWQNQSIAAVLFISWVCSCIFKLGRRKNKATSINAAKKSDHSFKTKTYSSLSKVVSPNWKLQAELGGFRAAKLLTLLLLWIRWLEKFNAAKPSDKSRASMRRSKNTHVHRYGLYGSLEVFTGLYICYLDTLYISSRWRINAANPTQSPPSPLLHSQAL